MLLEMREASRLLRKGGGREAGMEFLGYGLELGVQGGWTGRDGGPHAGRLHPVGTSAAPSGEKVPILEMKRRIPAERLHVLPEVINLQGGPQGPDLGGQYSSPTMELNS